MNQIETTKNTIEISTIIPERVETETLRKEEIENKVFFIDKQIETLSKDREKYQSLLDNFKQEQI